jgi:hypothetical protein
MEFYLVIFLNLFIETINRNIISRHLPAFNDRSAAVVEDTGGFSTLQRTPKGR